MSASASCISYNMVAPRGHYIRIQFENGREGTSALGHSQLLHLSIAIFKQEAVQESLPACVETNVILR